MGNELSQYLLKAAKGTVLFREGDPGDTMYFVQSGKIKIEKEMQGKQEILGRMEKGDFFGEMAVLEQAPRTATATVEEDAELLKIDHANFEKLLKANIEIAVRMIRKYVARVKDANSRLGQMHKDRSEISQGVEEIIHSVRNRTETIPAAVVPPVSAMLEGPKGTKFVIQKTSVTIGRADPSAQILPDIDLTEVDTTRSVSRRHAQILWDDGEFYVFEEVGVSNGTQMDGKQLKSGEPTPIKNGSKIKFGQVELTFKV